MEQFKKDLQLWYGRLERRGKLVVFLAVIALIWLIARIVLAIAGVSLGLGIFGIILNILAIILISLVITQFIIIRNMMRDARSTYKEMAMRGKRGGNPMENIAGNRNAGSLRKRGGNNSMAAVSAMTGISQSMIDKQYRPQVVGGKPTVIEDWMAIEEPGMYALVSAPKAKVEIIEATALGGGYFVGKYSEGVLKERTLMMHRGTGEPLRFQTIRHAKKALAGKSNPGKKRQTKKKKRRK